MRLKLSDILRPNPDWTVRKVDFNDPEVIEALERCKQAQARNNEYMPNMW